MNSTSNTNSTGKSTEAALQEHIRGQHEEIFAQLSEIIAFNSVYLPDNPELKEEHTNAGNWVDAALADAGLEVSAIPTADGSAVFALRRRPGR